MEYFGFEEGKTKVTGCNGERDKENWQEEQQLLDRNLIVPQDRYIYGNKKIGLVDYIHKRYRQIAKMNKRPSLGLADKSFKKL